MRKLSVVVSRRHEMGSSLKHMRPNPIMPSCIPFTFSFECERESSALRSATACSRRGRFVDFDRRVIGPAIERRGKAPDHTY
jgi:hypothetical protein